MGILPDSGVAEVIVQAVEGRFFASTPLPHGLRLRRPPTGRPFISQGEPIHRLHILLAGSCAVVILGSDGRTVIADRMAPVQILGLSETLRGVETYDAAVEAGTGAVLLEIPLPLFQAALSQSLPLCRTFLRYLAVLAVRNMDKADQKALVSPRDSLGFYLYRSALGKHLPCFLPVSREQLAAELHLNLRTLYRYLDWYKAQGMLLPRRGKLAMDKGCFQKLKAAFGDRLSDLTRG